MLFEKDIDVAVAEARGVFGRLNRVLDPLQEAGVECVSVGGKPMQSMFSVPVCPLGTRVSLVLDFKAQAKITHKTCECPAALGKPCPLSASECAARARGEPAL